VLISPFIKLPGSLYQNLQAADQRGVKISVVYGKSQLEPDTVKRLTELANAKVYFLENLHAKCYFNEQSMVITSLNLYDFSEANNREMGVLISKQEDTVYTEAMREARMILDLAVRYDPHTQVTERPKAYLQASEEKEKRKSIWRTEVSEIISSFLGKHNGFCIGCGTRVDFEEDRPYCPRTAATTINKVRCRACYDRSAV